VVDRLAQTCWNSICDWSLNLQNHAGTDIIYFDFKKAFDSVSYPKLIAKLNSYGISGLLLSWINAFLYGRSHSTMFNSCQSDLVSVISGVPQGSVLVPTLFLLYIPPCGNGLVEYGLGQGLPVVRGD
jgi:Reverse transcriptase (RNA-dependent DNA polymerase)